MADAIKIDGLAEFTRNLKKLDSDIPKMQRVGFNAAAQIVIDYAKPRVPRRSGRAASTLAARSTQTSVRVSGGGRKAPYYPWLDFGGRVGKNRSVSRPFFSGGRYLYPALSARREAILEAVREALMDSARAAGFEVT